MFAYTATEAGEMNSSNEMTDQEEEDVCSPDNQPASQNPSSNPAKDVHRYTDSAGVTVERTTDSAIDNATQKSSEPPMPNEHPDSTMDDSQHTQDEREEQKDAMSEETSGHDDSMASSYVEEQVASDMESIPATSWLPSSFEEVRKLIRTHEANIVSHREYVVEAQLASAKLKSKQNIHTDTEKKGVNPFKNWIAAMPDASSVTHLPNTLNMRIKPRRGDYTSLKAHVSALGDDRAAHIPEYKSIGRLRSTFLARNVQGLKYVPYHSGIEEKDLDQRRKDLETRFKDHSSEEFRRQRECLESVYQWSGDFDEILQELSISEHILWKWLLQSSLTKCQKCQTSCGSPQSPTFSKVEPSRAEKQRCHWLYEAFMKITQIGIWHFVSPRPGQVEKNQCVSQDTPNAQQSRYKREQSLCSLCFTHNCLTHGTFIDTEVPTGEAVINDAEEHNNERQKTVLKLTNKREFSHICGLYCFRSFQPFAPPYRGIIGLDADGLLRGSRNEKVSMLTDFGPFRGNEPCKRNCFLETDNRPTLCEDALVQRVPAEIRKLILTLSRVHSSHLRLPCMIGKAVNIECMTAFYTMLHEIAGEHNVEQPQDQWASEKDLWEVRKVPAKGAGYNTVRSALLENRKTWIPCSHKGPCLPTVTNCACAREQVHCEKPCGCSEGCKRRFKGCRCKKICFLDDRCDCYAANRECDPMLCHDCGVEEVLDPSNKYRDDIRNNRCRNNRLQLDLPPRTVKGMSEVQGWGLFLGEDLPANSFVGEYKGENISATESDRRGAIYAYVSQEYLFNLNKDNQLDGSRFGNKTRFINNSKAKEFINVFPKVMFVNGVTRIGLFTSRAIKAGEELLYDYGYPAELVKGEFWEKHERAIEHNGVVTPIAKPKFRPRMAKNAVDTPGQEDDEPTPVRKNGRSPTKQKRKRRIADLADSDEEGPSRHMITNGGTDSSEYEAEDSSSEEEASSHESAEQEIDESSDELGHDSPVAKRNVAQGRIDRRRGGEAQRRAAETRKLNKLRGR